MTDQELIEAVAVWLGWTEFDLIRGSLVGTQRDIGDGIRRRSAVPDWLYSLDEAHGVVMTLDVEQRSRWGHKLESIMMNKPMDEDVAYHSISKMWGVYLFDIINATPRQRIEAFMAVVKEVES